MNKINVAVFFGGDSMEHDVSNITGLQVVNALNKNMYTIYPIYIDKKDKWHYIKNYSNISDIKLKNNQKINISSGYNYFNFKNIFKSKIKIHVAILALHGGKGENGSISGILESLHIPYISSNVLSSSITLDKGITKLILKSKNYNVLPYIELRKKDKNVLNDFINKEKFPLVVKPIDMGSSIAVSFVKNEKELLSALNLVFNYTDTAIVEKGIENVVEYNCSAFMIEDKVITSDIEHPIKHDEILSYKDKYGNNGNKGCKKIHSKGMHSLSREFPANITQELKEEIQALTKKAYLDFKCSGIIRCDFIYFNNEIYLNEINSIPGSLAFYLWKNQKLTFSELLNINIKEALRKNNIKTQIK